jgi:hypothetical protein
MSALVSLILVVSQGFAAPNEAKMVESSREVLLEALRVRALYVAPEFPEGCLTWSGTGKGDSVLFAPKVSKATRCAEVPAIQEKMLVTKQGKVIVADGNGRVPLEALMPVEDGSHDGGGTSMEESQDNMIDVILAGGGGSMKKGERARPDPDEDGRASATGGRAGWGTGNGGTRQGKLALGAGGSGQESRPRAKLDPPKPSELTISGDSGVRTPESILRVLRQHVGGFLYAYQKYLRNDPDLGGKITLKFTISRAGDIVAISVLSSNTGNASLDDEIKDKARRMKFDQIEKGMVTATYGFVLDKH